MKSLRESILGVANVGKKKVGEPFEVGDLMCIRLTDNIYITQPIHFDNHRYSYLDREAILNEWIANGHNDYRLLTQDDILDEKNLPFFKELRELFSKKDKSNPFAIDYANNDGRISFRWNEQQILIVNPGLLRIINYLQLPNKSKLKLESLLSARWMQGSKDPSQIVFAVKGL